MREFPTLRYLRTFEVVGRLLSYRFAAEELGIGWGGVAHQMLVLQRELGVSLIERKPLRLTAEGRRYHEAVSAAFDGLRKATVEVTLGFRHQLRIRSDVTLAKYWLMPRLNEFQLKHPDIQVVLDSSAYPVEILPYPAHAEIHLMAEPIEHQCCDMIFRNRLIPVCSSRYLAARNTLRETTGPELLRECTLLVATPRRSDWKDWAQAAGFSDMPLTRLLMCESSAVALRAASLGYGVAITTLELVGEQLATGEFVVPYTFTLDRGEMTYYLTYSPERLTQPEFVIFRNWLLSHVPGSHGLSPDASGFS